MELLTAHVGSMPKDAALRVARRRFADGRLTAEALRAEEDRAAAATVVALESIGLDEITDGHPDRGDLVAGFAGALDGIERGAPTRVIGDRYVLRPRIVAPPRRVAAVTVERWRSSSGAADRPVRATVPSPYTLALSCLDEHHATRAAALDAFARIVADEVRDLVAAGAAVVQIDEIALGARADEVATGAAAIASVARAAGDRARVWLRFAYGDFADVADALFGLPLHGLAVSWGSLGAHGVAALGDLPAGIELGVGVVEADVGTVERVEDVVARAEAAAAAARRARIWIQPDAGLQGLPEDVARGKLAALVAAARAGGG